MLRSIEAHLGATQDVEWALCGGTFYVLQARPVTSPAGVIWDNSNIAESYGGLVSPLTFSFARYAYAAAYRELMHVFGIDRKTIADHDGALQNMLGLISGRMYYHLLNWYCLLALVPGFRLNRRFMESMMGVGESLPQQTLHEIARKGRTRDLFAATKMVLALLFRYARLDHDIEVFHRRIASALSISPSLEQLDPAGLLKEFSRLESALLTHWEAPLVNDFFAMVFHGTLRALVDRWCADADGSLHNDLLCAAGGMVSTEPARRIAELADLVRGDEELIEAMRSGDAAYALGVVRARPPVFDGYLGYLDRFGDRCPNELKLESFTLHDDPLPLLESIARLAKDPSRGQMAADSARAVRRSAEVRLARALRRRPLRSLVVSFVLRHARIRIRERENLRLERTRAFARVRRIMVELGRQLHARGHLTDARDVFFIELPELRAAVAEPDQFRDLRDLVEKRRALYADYASQPAPPDRFTAIGANAPPAARTQPNGADDSTRTGTGCCPGTVRARVRVIRDVHSPLQSGEILVAERTDPGWIVLFPAAAGILVERGSLLSHAAIVSRELGIPSVVGIAGLMQWLHDGDMVELDGRNGVVRRLEAAVP
jgi:pyruvate,water dikinase